MAINPPEPTVFKDPGAGVPTRRSASVVRLAFVGPYGIRAGWRLLVFVAIAAAFAIILAAPLSLLGPRASLGGAFRPAALLLVGFSEEFLFRGYALYTLSTGIGFWPAAGLLSALFGAVHLHNPGESWIGGLSAGLIGLFFCFTVRRTGSLWFAIGLHAAWDYSESFVYSVPDSGAMVPGHLLNSSFHGPRWLTGGTVGPP